MQTGTDNRPTNPVDSEFDFDQIIDRRGTGAT